MRICDLSSDVCSSDLVAIALLLFACLWFAGPAFAGADTTFDTALTRFTAFLEGSGGQRLTVLSLAGGIVALASGRSSMGQIAIPVGVGVGAGTGIPIVTSTGTAPLLGFLRSDEFAASNAT